MESNQVGAARTRVVVVVGAGPGVGAAVAHRFGREGFHVALLGRTEATLAALGAELAAAGVTAGWRAVDVTDEAALAAAVRRVGEQRGRIDVLHFNPSRYRHEDPLHLSVQHLLADVHLGAGALLTAVQAARPFMTAGGRVTVTGSMAADHPAHEACSLGVQKAAVRNLVHSLDRTLAPDHIRAVSVTVNGTLAPGTAFSPERVAAAIYDAASGPEDGWRSEVPLDG